MRGVWWAWNRERYAYATNSTPSQYYLNLKYRKHCKNRCYEGRNDIYYRANTIAGKAKELCTVGRWLDKYG